MPSSRFRDLEARNVNKSLFVTAFAVLATASQAVVVYTGGLYHQDFDTLPVMGNSAAWANDSTLTGWFSLTSNLGSQSTGRDVTANWAAPATIVSDDGSSSVGSIYSYGPSTFADGSIGSVPTDSLGDTVTALVIQNATGSTISGFSLHYQGEQWRNGGNASAQHLIFDYAVISSFSVMDSVPMLRGDNTAGYFRFSNDLDLTSPTTGPDAGPLNGNVAPNAVDRTDFIPQPDVPNGSFLILRWWNDNIPGSDHGLAIDDLSFQARLVPEPTTFIALIIPASLLMHRRKKANKGS
jgi:hypothetical protein